MEKKWSLCCLMTPDLRKDIGCHVWLYSFCYAYKSSDLISDIGQHVMVIAYGQLIPLNVLCEFIPLTYSLYNPQG